MFAQYLRRFLAMHVIAPPPPPPEMEVGCVPIRWGTRSPDTSDGYGLLKRRGKGHLGVDLMFRRASSGAESRPHLTKHYECPTGVVEVLCCSSGTVKRISNSANNGGALYISHGRYMSVYRHLDQKHSHLWPKVGEVLLSGQVVGIVGHAPSAKHRGINHLHFEIWDTRLRGRGGKYNRRRQAIDPGPFLKRWERSAQIFG